jgi:hypothetical protein
MRLALAAIVLCPMVLCGCGTTVPSVREWPNTSPLDEETMVQEIVRSVRCELRTSITRIILQDQSDARRRVSGKRYTDFLNGWGVEVALNLTVVEKGSVSPTVLLTPPSIPTFTLSGGLSGSSEATRIEKMNTFYTIKQLFRPGQPRCERSDGNWYGSLLIASDLHLYTMLESRIGVAALDYADLPGAGDKNVLSENISFKLETTGNVNPSWKLVRATVNPSGNLFSASRDNTQELVITFGPIDRAKGGRSLIAIAEQAHQNSQLQSGIRNLLLPR